MTWRVQEVAEIFISSSQKEDVLDNNFHIFGKFRGKTSTDAEDYMAKEVPWLRKFYGSIIGR